ncbi:Trm112 family protein [Geomonas sp. Red32]|uniref:Trm112 family protein n=1 Tax=Geomonas sp. Red32 TaxID=2912856 RepID=UPI00202CC93B|nr:Trm112 family protein [Geomonas sp. Red32]MCM0082809.1 Trm112 family protein [Geomonas sp. Red32]
MAIPKALRDILACPNCHGALAEGDGHLCCPACSLRFAVREGIPVLLPGEAEKERP